MYKSFYSKKIINTQGDKLIFLDRDGVLNKDTGYIDKLSRVEILHKNLEFIRNIIKKRAIIKPIYVIVSNQSGVARGYFSLNNAFEIMDFVAKKIENILPISSFYFAPFHSSHSDLFIDPQEAIFYRKPNPGMFLKTSYDYKLSLSNSLMFGDKITDRQAAVSAGIKNNNIYLI